MDRKTVYDNVVLLGSEKIGKKILRELVRLREEWGYRLSFFEYNHLKPTGYERMCEEYDVEYESFGKDKSALTEKLLRINDKTLVFSVRNTYLFPEMVVKRPNISIVNCHSALLPKYPGRNSPTWAIFCGESVSGPTWHWINAGIDSGEILWQRECQIDEDMKAYELTKQIEDCSYEGFLEIIENLLSGTAKSYPQPKVDGEGRKLYLSKEIPANGKFCMEDDPEYIYRLLRAVDYGPNPVFPKLRTEIEGAGLVEITGYKKSMNEECALKKTGRVRIPYGNSELILKYRII